MNVHLLGGQKIQWALDEDLRWARRALDGTVRFSPLPLAGIVHSAWWPALLAAGPAALSGKFVVCFADNPPAFYLTCPQFRQVAGRVDLWVARTREAKEQFEALGFPVRVAPYCIDPGVFKPLPGRDAIRAGLGIPEGSFVIGNFHRDSEGADLGRPKMQKGPDVFFEIAAALHARVPSLVVLLAGPRRHWLRRSLERAGIPVIFHGRETGDADDYGINILSKEDLNRLYQALDVCVISSRWEGGPYSVLEALFSARPVISTPVGTSRDVLDPAAVYSTAGQAVDLLEAHYRNGLLSAPAEKSRAGALQTHSEQALQKALRTIYASLPDRTPSLARAVRSMAGLLRRKWPDAPEPGEMTASVPGTSTFWPAAGGDLDALKSCAAAIAACTKR